MRGLAAALMLVVLSAAGLPAQQNFNAQDIDRDQPRVRHVVALLEPLLSGDLEGALASIENGAVESSGDAVRQAVRQLATQFGAGQYRLERLLDGAAGVIVLLHHASGPQAGLFVVVEAAPPHRIVSVQQGMLQGGGNVQLRPRAPAAAAAPPAVAAPATPDATGASSVMLVHAAAEFEVHAPTPDALERGRIAMEHVVGEYHRYFEAAPPRMGFVVYTDREQARGVEAELGDRNVAAFAWPAETRSGPVGDDGLPGWVPRTINHLAHEAMHGLMRARFGQRALPAWFDEGIASLIEFPEDQAVKYWDRLLAEDAEFTPLETLFARPHPVSGITLSGAAAATALADAQAGRPIRVAVSPEQHQDSPLFYAQSMAFLTFLAEREGAPFVGRMAGALAGGASVEEVLKTGRSFAGGTADLDAAWREWLRQRAR